MISHPTTEKNDRSFSSRRRAGVREMFSENDFRQVCEYERLRADRGEGSFAMMTLKFAADHELAHCQASMKRVIQGRIRQIDECGYLSGGRLGILTPNTSSRGVSVLAEDLMSRFPASLPRPSIEIFEHQGDRSDKSTEPPHPKNDGRHQRVPTLDAGTIFVDPMPLWKRSIDVIGAVGGLIFSLPLFLVIAATIRVSSKGPAIYTQSRTGRGGNSFRMFKFRTMIAGAEQHRDDLLHLNEQDGPAFKMPRDPRITRIGHWLRRLSLDELPQLWNVLKGDMSIVGPRPLPCDEANGCEPWQRRRLAVVPGLTCTWQVQDRSNPVPFAEWMRMDIRYAQSISLKKDLQLVLRTVGFLLGRRNR